MSTKSKHVLRQSCESTSYYPQRNGQTEVTNINFLEMRSQIVYEEPRI